jgi:diguanylate cyclase (GGDEF)-like protein
MNELKRLNDGYGHHVGDRALQRVGATLAAMQRTTDLCVRYGGDEFVVVLWGCGAPQAEERRRQLQHAVADLRFFVPTGNPVELSVSAGAATFPDDGTTADALLAIADQRMYVDKALRRRSASESDARPGASLRVAI